MRPPRQQGILPDHQIKHLIQEGAISASPPIEDQQIQPASLDLRLGTEAFRLKCSFLPERNDIFVKQHDWLDVFKHELVMYPIDLSDGAILEQGHVYLVRLLEELHLPKGIYGRANPKSSTGRLDIFTRVITALNVGFDDIKEGYSGPIHLEIVPRSFTIKVKTGMSLNQLRFIKGRSGLSDIKIKKLHKERPLLYDFDHKHGDWEEVKSPRFRVDHGLFLSVDLKGNANHQTIGYKAKRISNLLDLFPEKIGQHEVEEFWEPLKANRNGTLILEPEEFYILASKERIRVPAGYAAEMVAYEAACGELRTHYAGFFDPGFGFGDGTMKGTQVVLEVRPHDVPFLIHHGQNFFKVEYEILSEQSENLYGPSCGSSYHQQGLTLSKHFKW